MTDTVVETTAPKSVGPGKAKSIALNIIPPILFGALAVSYTHLTLPTSPYV